MGRLSSTLKPVTDGEPKHGYTYRIISKDPANDETGKVRLEPLGPNRTRFHFEERYNIAKAPFKWFEGPIYKFINKQNELSMRRASDWLTRHPEYRADPGDAPSASPSQRRAPWRPSHRARS